MGVTHIPAWKFTAIREAVLQSLSGADASGLSLKDLRIAAKGKMRPETLEKLGSWGWHFTTTKLEMEVAGDLSRIAGRSPQHVVLT